MKRDDVKALFTLAGFTVHNMWELPNGYWPLAYAELRAENPWWLVRTEFGCIEIGRRKRVWSVDWSDTDVRGTVTDDQTTSAEDAVHAWTLVKLLEYLTALNQIAKKAAKEPA